MGAKIAHGHAGGQTHVVNAEIVYRAAAMAAPPVLRLAAPFSPRVRQAVDGRRESLAALQAWGNSFREPDRPLMWLHAPSVGEALMAQAILAAARALEPRLQAAFTFFSPSAERMAARVGADWHGYLPWDTTGQVERALDALQPTSLVFVRTEIWPVLLHAARRREARVVLANAVLAAGSSRVGAGARMLLGHAYRQLDAVGAVTADDGARFSLLGVQAERVHVTGDARFDQVWQRINSLQPQPLVAAIRAAPGPWIVAGSTWPADEVELVPALRRLRDTFPACRAVIAPHQPDPAHVGGLEQRLTAAGLSHARLPGMESAAVPDAAVIVVDRVGVLADLYRVADVAYVGGGFGSDGLHSVVEPAALGVPVLFGPQVGNASEASRLAAHGGGSYVGGSISLCDALSEWCDVGGRSDAGRVAGVAAQRFVQQALGGAQANARLALPPAG